MCHCWQISKNVSSVTGKSKKTQKNPAKYWASLGRELRTRKSTFFCRKPWHTHIFNYYKKFWSLHLKKEVVEFKNVQRKTIEKVDAVAALQRDTNRLVTIQCKEEKGRVRIWLRLTELSLEHNLTILELGDNH